MAKVPGFAKAFAGRWRTCGRGWVMIGTAGRLVGRFYIHWRRFRLRLRTRLSSSTAC